MTRHKLLSPDNVPPLRSGLRCIGVFNPGVTRLADGRILMLVRIAVAPLESPPDAVGILYWEERDIRSETVASDDIRAVDSRMVRRRGTQVHRLTFTSYLQPVWVNSSSRDPDEWTFTWGDPLLPEGPLEIFGIEDARITQIDDTYYVTYVGVSDHGVCTSLMSTKDFVRFQRHGVIFWPENKDVLLFPERIHGRYHCLHRPNPRTPFCPPEIWWASSADLIDWGHHQPLLTSANDWESGKIGGGTPPVRINQGWLTFYHGNRQPERPGEIGRYEAACLLLDPSQPQRVIARSERPELVPEEPWEVNGFVPQVVFPTGLVLDGERVDVFYGAADTHTAVARFALSELRIHL